MKINFKGPGERLQDAKIPSPQEVIGNLDHGAKKTLSELRHARNHSVGNRLELFLFP
jgi:hypothetical protein